MMNIARNFLFFANFLIASCAHETTELKQVKFTLSEKINYSDAKLQIEGRIALLIYSNALPGQAPDQQFSSAFQLQGNADVGQMQLTSPLGNVLASLEWSPTQARLFSSSKTQDFASLDAMLLAVTGAALPSRALLAWLRGEAMQVEGWAVDLGAHGRGRFQAERHHPGPRVELRVVLE